jgi:aryl-alcohol dehydrogenase-like predicted oxidoreductase
MIEKRAFGRTGHMSSATLFGAAALGRVSQSEAERTLDLALEYGLNHIDTANSYGESEKRIGPWLANRREQFFLATKTGERTYRGAWDHLTHSLELLHTDHIDLWQMHNLVDPLEWEIAMGPGGVLEAFIEAKKQGLVRFLGVTGHGVTIADMHRRSLERFDFDSVLLPYNFVMMQNAEYAASFEALMTLCQSRQVAVQTIKSICRRGWGDRPQTRATWYEPFEDQAEIDTAVHWVLGRPGIFLNTAGDIHVLPKVLDAAGRFDSRPQDEVMQQQMARQSVEPLFV